MAVITIEVPDELAAPVAAEGVGRPSRQLAQLVAGDCLVEQHVAVAAARRGLHPE